MKFPEKCPHCGKDIVPHLVESSSESPNRTTFYSCELHKCMHCNEPIFLFKENRLVDKKTVSKIVHCFPISRTVAYPDRVKMLSENAYNAYCQAYQANELGHNMLVGAGLRIALEWLVWDYLITVKHIPQADIEKKTLSERIRLMDGSFYVEICAKLIRLFGNDQVHIVKMLDFSNKEVFFFFNSLCILINSELEILEANERLTH